MVEEKKQRKPPRKESEASPQAPSQETSTKRETSAVCTDKKCTTHGNVTIRGRVFEGIIVSDKMQRTVTVEWPRLSYLPKFERYEKRRSRVKAHNPPCISAKSGEKVRIAECRPLAKTVKFAVIEKLVGTI